LARIFREEITQHRGRLVVALTCMAVVAATTAGTAYMLDPAIKKIFLEPDPTALFVIPLVVIGLSMTKALATYIQAIAMSTIGQSVVSNLQRRLSMSLLRADLAWLDQRHSGGLLSSLVNDTQHVQDATAQVMTALVRDGLTMVFLVAVMFYQDWELAAIGVFVVLPGAQVVQKMSKKTRKASHATFEETGTLASLADDALKGIREVRAYGQEEHEIKRIGRSIDRRLGHIMAAIRAKTLSGPVAEALSGVGIAAAIIYAGWRGMEGDLGLNNFVSFLGAMMMAYQPMRSLANSMTRLHEGAAAADRVFGIIDTRPNILSPQTPKALAKPTKGAVVFEHVSFSYDGEHDALSDLSVHIPAGSIAALVGPSGSGKSTMMNLIPRFYDAVQGQVLIDGMNVRDLSLEELRGQISIVSQDPFLFDDTIAANIAYGRISASKAEIEEAARHAAAHDFIMELQGGYEARVGEAGSRLSGGQKQRIAIARAMLKNAPILLLDEATSALDNESERLVQKALEKLMKGRTTIMIAHRLSTIAHADMIFVMKEGRVAERGKHDALLQQDGLYARLHAKGLGEAGV